MASQTVHLQAKKSVSDDCCLQEVKRWEALRSALVACALSPRLLAEVERLWASSTEVPIRV
jgi:hypothetical protein